MDGVIKLARQVIAFSSQSEQLYISLFQYFVDTGQSQRTNFIARRLSFHGNTLGSLALSDNPARRAPYEDILDHKHFHHVSPAYAKRYQRQDESEAQYVERLCQELEDKFLELGPNTVIGCKSSLSNAHSCILIRSSRG
jgi:adenosylmethionine-8-amino-7-oxononanoate aminotransferase